MDTSGGRAQSAARLSLLYNIFQTALKLVGASLTGSVSLLSEGLHSLSDVLSSFVSFVSVRASSAPPDEDHPYGHGKIDTLAGLLERRPSLPLPNQSLTAQHSSSRRR